MCSGTAKRCSPRFRLHFVSTQTVSSPSTLKAKPLKRIIRTTSRRPVGAEQEGRDEHDADSTRNGAGGPRVRGEGQWLVVPRFGPAPTAEGGRGHTPRVG